MGYSYSGNRLCCDNCGRTGGVRKRTCPHKVRNDSFRSVAVGVRHEVPYCQPPALCSACYAGLKATLHEPCKEGARLAQEKADRTEALLESGAFLRAAAWGDWHAKVPAGRVGVLFVNRAKEERCYHVDKEEYRAGGVGTPTTPDDYAGAVPMERI